MAETVDLDAFLLNLANQPSEAASIGVKIKSLCLLKCQLGI